MSGYLGDADGYPPGDTPNPGRVQLSGICGYNKTGFKDLMSGILTCHVAFLLERNCESIKQHLALSQVVKEKETIDSEQGGHSSRCKTFWNKSSCSRCYEIHRKLHSELLVELRIASCVLEAPHIFHSSSQAQMEQMFAPKSCQKRRDMFLRRAALHGLSVGDCAARGVSTDTGHPDFQLSQCNQWSAVQAPPPFTDMLRCQWWRSARSAPDWLPPAQSLL
ncbi:unnamed protein product [Leuciscus chuanchicus]